MKTVIKSLKELIGFESNTELSQFLGVTRQTLWNMEQKDCVLSPVLPMLEYCLRNMSDRQRKSFCEKFKPTTEK